MSPYKDLAEKILRAMAVRESSWAKNPNDDSWYAGSYQLTYHDAALKVAEDKQEAYLIYLVIATAWNDIADWAQEVLA